LEEGVLPHQRSFDDPEEMAEERRLMYVGVTRAMNRLYLSRVFRRTLRGQSDVANPSRFLEDIPVELIQGTYGRASRRAARPHQVRRYLGKRDEQVTSWRPTFRPADEGRVAQFRTGERVRHPTFGEGIVIETRLHRDDEEVSVAFEDDRVGIKRLLTSFARLDKLT
jgi:DNA helicase-2/ATP-dependent DNA helicase PcrA